jgi:hypothetical protein
LGRVRNGKISEHNGNMENTGDEKCGAEIPVIGPLQLGCTIWNCGTSRTNT